MKILKAKNYADLSKKAASIISAQMIEKPNSVLGLATGSTPLGVYRELVSLYEEGLISFEDITTFNLDEYYGLAKGHSQSYFSFMNENLFSKVDIDKNNCNIPDGNAKDVEAECEAYENKIKLAGGVDLQLLGIGRNGHIGFNEPSTSFAKKTYLVDLTADTINANAKYFSGGEKPPCKAISMGIGTIMQANKVLLIASGPSKTKAIERMVDQAVSPDMPASVLQFHKDTTVIYCD
jgi:glucosamine-6-phosphate deaminase